MLGHIHTKHWIFTGAMIGLLSLPSISLGFGKNKVQYERLHWQCLKADYFSIYVHQNTDSLGIAAYQLCSAIYPVLSQTFRFRHNTVVPVIVFGSPNLFEQTNVVPDIIPEGVGGFTEIFKNRIVVPWTGSYRELRHVLHHELVHAFEFGILYDRLGGSFLRNSGLQLPLWFAEGLAEYLSTGWDTEADMFLMDRVVHGEVGLPGPDLSGYMAYKGGQSFLLFLSHAYGDTLFHRFLQAFRETRNVDIALERTYRQSVETLGEKWQQQIRRLYWPEIARRQQPDDISVCLTKKHFGRTHYNLKPRISPDGSRIAFFSDRDDLTAIFVVDRNGKIVTRIPQQGYGGYFESFHPFRSGLCWAPDGTRLAFVTKVRGRDEIRIVDILSRKLTGRYTFAGLSSISSPDWSPDGTRLVFTAIAGSCSDIYLFSLQDSSLVRLSHDPAFESSPCFSPDGDAVVFAVEDTAGVFATENPHRSISSNLAMVKISDLSVRRLTATPWNNREPRFAGHDTIIFVSDRNGVYNIYRGHLDSLEHARPLTDIIGGCSSADWSRDSCTLVFSLFQKGSWHVYLTTRADTLQKYDSLQLTKWAEYLRDSSIQFIPRHRLPDSTGTSRMETHAIKTSDPSAPTAKLLPSGRSAHVIATDSIMADSSKSTHPNPSPTDTSIVSAAGLPAPSMPSPTPYRLKFSPDVLAFGLGVSSLYGYAGQWYTSFSDLMGDHRITVAGDLAGRLDEYIHLYGAYLNTRYRLGFGVAAFHGRHYTLSGALYHDRYTGGQTQLAYPFSLRSRTAFDCYYSHIERKAISAGALSSSFDILLPSLSYVYDNVVWGMTGPVNGTRTRVGLTFVPPAATFEAAFVSGEIDWRRYFHFGRRFVLAIRTTTGASMPLAENKATRRYILGGTDFWFNYRVNPQGYETNLNNIFYSDIVLPFRGWLLYDLSGTRFGVLNTEFRFPFIKEISFVWPLPLTLRYLNGAVFVDVGNAWDAEDEYSVIPLPRTLYGGYGFGLRADLGLFVLRYDRAWRTDWQTFVNRPVNYWALGADF